MREWPRLVGSRNDEASGVVIFFLHTVILKLTKRNG